MRSSGKTSSTPGEPIVHRAGPGGERKRVKRGAALLFASFGSACPHASRMYFPLLSNKTELEHGAGTLVRLRGVTLVHCFKFFVVMRQN